MPYICLTRTDIPNGTLQVLDLFPNTSLRNGVSDPKGQTKYVNRLQNDSVRLTGTATAAEFKGLAAYLIDVVADGTDGGALTAAEANTAATNIVALVNAGSAVTLVAVNAILAAVRALTALSAGGSVGTLASVLKILAGAEYVLPAGTAANPAAAAFKGALAGSFTTGQYKNTYESFALNISLGEGKLAALVASTFEYGDVAGRAVVVYDDSGNVLG